MIRNLTAVFLAISVAFSGLIDDGMAATKKKPAGTLASADSRC